jgi:hypothetical protein
MHKKCWSENLNGREHSENIDIDEKITLEGILVKYCGELWFGFIWLRVGTSGGLL